MEAFPSPTYPDRTRCVRACVRCPPRRVAVAVGGRGGGVKGSSIQRFYVRLRTYHNAT